MISKSHRLALPQPWRRQTMIRKSHRLAPPQPWRRPVPTPELIDDAIVEILLRLPPDDPSCLVRASLVCKLWRHILSEPTFPHRYHEFHGTLPLLGFLCGSYSSEFDESAGRFFVPITTTRRTIPFLHPVFGCQPLDCRHGRVLLDTVDGGTGMFMGSLAVWDPVTGNHKVLSDPDPAHYSSGAVLCAAPGCNHHRGCCHGGGPFLVVFVSTSYNSDDGTMAAWAWLYSSETAAWSAPASVQIQCDGFAFIKSQRAAIVGDEIIYFLLSPGAGILQYDLGKRCLTVVGSPRAYTYAEPAGILMTMEDGSSLGFASVKDDYSMTLHLWRATKVNSNGSSMGWVEDRVISLNNLVPFNLSNQEVNVVGFAEGVDILLLAVGETGRVFMLELKSGKIRKLSKHVYWYYGAYFPYLSFYIPGFANSNCQQIQNKNE